MDKNVFVFEMCLIYYILKVKLSLYNISLKLIDTVLLENNV